MLLSYLGQEHPTFTQTSAGDFIKAIITISANASQNEQSCIGPNSLTRQLVSDGCIKPLIADMLKGGNPLTVGVGIIIEVIRKNNSDYDPEITAGQEQPPASGDPIYLGTLLRLFASHIPDFMDLILSSNHTISAGDATVSVKRKELQVAFGKSIEPLGFDRFKTCELMAELLHCSNMGLLNEPGSEAYVRQRDKEREKLRADGMLIRPREPQSAVTEFSEDEQNLRGDSGSPELIMKSPEEFKKLELSSAEDEGFEHVGASGDLADEIRDDFDEKDAFELESGEGPSPIKPSKSRLSLDDEFFDEPLHSPPKPSSIDSAASGTTRSDDSKKDADSPATNLASDVIHLELERDDVTEPMDAALKSPTEELVAEIEAHLSPTREAPPLPEREQGLNVHEAEGGHSPGGMSPHAEDTPAPLFTPNATSENIMQLSAPEETNDHAQQGGPAENTQQEGTFSPHIEYDVDGKPIVGDYLKMQFVEHQVVPTILVRISMIRIKRS